MSRFRKRKGTFHNVPVCRVSLNPCSHTTKQN
nr:MAG TPA: hypothetical protein [Bacteriophage sp.]DAR94174.1 MAG TPA: hypothetical protein [Caudoviricetes sp.]